MFNVQKFSSSSARICIRQLSTQQLVYSEHGDPVKVLKLQSGNLPDEVENGEVLVKYMACAVNPADINMIQGVYPIKPKLPAIGGNEGVGRVEKVGSSVKSVSVGNWVLPAQAGTGTWQSHGIYPESDIMRVSSDIPLSSAATMLVNPTTAYRMLKDFQDLSPGDTVIQNGANSAVGRCVIQIAKELGLRSTNVVRDRDNFEKLKTELENLGAEFVVKEKERGHDPDLRALIKKIGSAPKLALNCVGGKSAMYLAATLGYRGKMVTYGGMSKQPLQIPTGPLIFNQIELHGFWMSHWYTFPENFAERGRMMSFLEGMMKRGTLAEPDCDFVPLKDFEKAMQVAASGSGKKQILVMESRN